MDYKKAHDNLIERAQKRILPPDQYREKHHIIPRCLGGTDDPDNLVELTAREHYVVHQLLIKMYPNENGLVWAAQCMTIDRYGNRVNNRLYEWLKIKTAEITSKRTKKRWKNREYRKHMAVTHEKFLQKNPEHYEKMNKAVTKFWSDSENRKRASDRVKGKKNPNYGTHWYHHPETLHNTRCKPDDVPEGYIKGRMIAFDKPNASKPNTRCVVCDIDTGSKNKKYCSHHCRNAQKRKVAYDLLERYIDSTFESINQFADSIGIAQQNLSSMWKNNIVGYIDLSKDSSKHRNKNQYRHLLGEKVSRRSYKSQ